jgi:hypothetical protein
MCALRVTGGAHPSPLAREGEAVVWAKMHTLVLGKAITGYDAFS